MNNRHRISQSITLFSALVWIANGLLFKVFNLVPRHRQIVGAILGEQYASPLTVAIGVAEVGMAVWIISGVSRRFCTVVQIGIVAAMNTIEAIVVPSLLLFGYFNAVLALVFIVLILFNEFVLNKASARNRLLWLPF